MMPRLYTDGMLVVGDAAGLGVNSGFTVRGMDLAIGSALAAAETVLEARSRGDVSAQGLSIYPEKLDQTFVLADMRTYAHTPDFFATENLYKTYPEFLAHLMTSIYTQDARPKQHLVPTFLKSVKECRISLFEMARDVWKGVRAL
jgi:electron transfer flavoprotein-quinone oxidoreductase